MQLKEIHHFINELVVILQKKVNSQEKEKIPESIKEYTKGQLYEAGYILGAIEKIIYHNDKYIN
jgi:hypothetical protein